MGSMATRFFTALRFVQNDMWGARGKGGERRGFGFAGEALCGSEGDGRRRGTPLRGRRRAVREPPLRGMGTGEGMGFRMWGTRGKGGRGWWGRGGTGRKGREDGGRLTLCWRRGYTIFVSFPHRFGPAQGRRSAGSSRRFHTPESPSFLIYMKVLLFSSSCYRLSPRMPLPNGGGGRPQGTPLRESRRAELSPPSKPSPVEGEGWGVEGDGNRGRVGSGEGREAGTGWISEVSRGQRGAGAHKGRPYGGWGDGNRAELSPPSKPSPVEGEGWGVEGDGSR